MSSPERRKLPTMRDARQETEQIVAALRHATARTPKERAAAWAELMRLKQQQQKPRNA